MLCGAPFKIAPATPSTSFVSARSSSSSHPGSTTASASVKASSAPRASRAARFRAAPAACALSGRSRAPRANVRPTPAAGRRSSSSTIRSSRSYRSTWGLSASSAAGNVAGDLVRTLVGGGGWLHIRADRARERARRRAWWRSYGRATEGGGRGASRRRRSVARERGTPVHKCRASRQRDRSRARATRRHGASSPGRPRRTRRRAGSASSRGRRRGLSGRPARRRTRA